MDVLGIINVASSLLSIIAFFGIGANDLWASIERISAGKIAGGKEKK